MAIYVFGELALHVFVPSTSASTLPTTESPVQLGGGAGMIVRHLSHRGAATHLIGAVGDDPVATCIASLAALTSPESVVVRDCSATSSTVYIFHDARNVSELRIIRGTVSLQSLLPYAAAPQVEDVVYCPWFPGYELLARHLATRCKRLVLDFGFHDWSGNAGLIAERLSDAPRAELVVINGSSLAETRRSELRDTAISLGYERVIVTAGECDVLGFDMGHNFRITPGSIAAVCTVGAGDVMISEILLALSRLEDLQEATGRGCSAATSKSARWGV